MKVRDYINLAVAEFDGNPLKVWNALPGDIRERVIEWGRNKEVTTDYNWWDYIEDWFKEKMNQYGIEVDRIYFELYSQGSGACFDGRVVDWEDFLVKALSYDKKKDMELITFAQNHFCFYCKHSGHYYHKWSARFDYDIYLPEKEFDEEFIEAFWEEGATRYKSPRWWCRALSKYKEIDIIEGAKEFFRDQMDELYRTVEKEYKWLVSDEAIKDFFISNEHYLRRALREVAPSLFCYA